MDTKSFVKKSMFYILLFVVSGCSISKSTIDMKEGRKGISTLKPNRLKAGDTIGLIAPASSFDIEDYHKTVRNLENLGFAVKPAKNLFKKWGFLAGSDQERVDDIHEMFRDNKIDGIWCLRGGYGTTRMLHMLDYDLIRSNPKALIGYSDITALLHAIYINTGLVGFHGPVGKSTMTPYTKSSFEQVLMKPQPILDISSEVSGRNEEDQPYIITPGKARGKLSGGNLSLLSALTGTDNHWDAADKLVFIEDIEERPYRIDRMLTQLIQGANLSQAKGIILGIFSGCEKKPDDDKSLSLKEVLVDRLGSLGIPVYYGFSFGHVKENCTIPIGIEALFDTSNPSIQLVEKAVK